MTEPSLSRRTSFPLAGGPAELVGAFAVEDTPDGLTPRRLPADTHHLLDPMTAMAQKGPSGVRVAFRTDSPFVELITMPTGISMPEIQGAARTPMVDLLVDGELCQSLEVEGGRTRVMRLADRSVIELIEGPAATFRFDALGTATKAVELWLQPMGEVAVQELKLAPGATLEPPHDERPRWIHYGSSISQCSEATSPARVWPGVASRIANVHLTSLGLGGSCHLDQYVARTIRDTPAEVISMKLGINVVNAASLIERTFTPALHGLVDTVRDGHPLTPIVLASPILCPAAEDRPGPTVARDGVLEAVGDPAGLARGALTLRRIRELVRNCVAVRKARGDANLHYLDGLELFDEDDKDDLPDGLHPNGAGYERMGERFAALVFGDGGLVPAAALQR